MAVRTKPVDLDEGAGELLRFPRCRRFAGKQPHRDILDAHRLPRTQRKVADDAVALVEQAHHGDALGHRRHPWLLGSGARHVDRDRLGLGRLFATVAAARGQQQSDWKEDRSTGHAYSGFHAS